VCGFSDNGSVYRTFLIREEASNWLDTVVKPYRAQWEKAKSNTFTDPRDGKVYKIVKIGNQIWMAENLNYNAPGSQCYSYKYGRLYDWKTALKICPAGWHLPNDDEWQALFDFVGGIEVAGKKLKTRIGWNFEEKREDPKNWRQFIFEDRNGFNGNGEDAYGFSALPGGYGNFTNVDYDSNMRELRSFDERLIMKDVGDSGYWWSKGRHLKDIHSWQICRRDDNPYRSDLKPYLLSVRCVKD